MGKTRAQPWSVVWVERAVLAFGGRPSWAGWGILWQLAPSSAHHPSLVITVFFARDKGETETTMHFSEELWSQIPGWGSLVIFLRCSARPSYFSFGGLDFLPGIFNPALLPTYENLRKVNFDRVPSFSVIESSQLAPKKPSSFLNLQYSFSSRLADCLCEGGCGRERRHK